MEKQINGLTLQQFRNAFSKSLTDTCGFTHGDLNVLHCGMSWTGVAWMVGDPVKKSATDFSAMLHSLTI